MQTFQKIEDHFTGPEVEVAGRFVGEQDGGSADESTSQHDALLFPPG